MKTNLIVAHLPNPLKDPNVKIVRLHGGKPPIPSANTLFNIHYNENREGIVQQVENAKYETGPFRIKKLNKTDDAISFDLFEPVKKDHVIHYEFKKDEDGNWKDDTDSFLFFIQGL